MRQGPLNHRGCIPATSLLASAWLGRRLLRAESSEFVVNLKTAQALGIMFSNEIMLQVTEVIQ